MDKKLLKRVIIEIGCFVLQFIFSSVNILHSVYPVGLPFSLVRLFFGGNIFCVTGEYLLSKVILLTSFKWLIVTAFEIIILSLFYFANEFFKIKNKYIRISLFVVTSKMPELYFCLFGKGQIIVFIAGLLLSVLLSLYFLKLFVAIKNKSIFFKFSRLDYLIFSVLVLLISFGIFEYKFISEKLYLFFIAFPVIILCRLVEPEKAFINSGVMSLGFCLLTGQYQVLFFEFVLSCVMVNLKDINKYLYAVVFSIICTIFVFLFDFLSIFELISLYFAVLLFVIIPDKVITKLSELFEINSGEVITREVLKGKVNLIGEKLELMSDTLGAMQRDFKYLIVGKINREKASAELSQDIIASCCKKCENYKVCFSGNIQKKAYFDALLYKAFVGGQINFEDVSTGLQSYCNKTGIIVSEINQIAQRFLSYETTMKTEDASKLIISSELENFSDIFTNFAKLIKFDCKINKKSSKNIKEMFLKSLIDVKEVVVYENDSGIESVNVIASNLEILKREFSDVISSVTKVKMEIDSVKHLEYSGISLAKFVPAGNLKIDFAISSKSKEGANGDNATVVKLSKNKFLVAITDGMGHGEKANKISSMVLSLIEAMYKIGLDDKLVIDSVNKLLLPAGLDNFTTLDACIIDLDRSVAEFVKLGSSISVLKRSNQSEIISGESLPIGIVQNIKPTIIKKQLFLGDIIVLASDGVVDSFDSVELYKSFINDSKIFNLKQYTDSLIFDAGYQNQAHPDDMTVIAINLLKK